MYVPETLEDLLAYIDRSPSNGTHMIANGSDLMNRIQRRQVNVKTLIDLSGFRELNYVKKENNTLRIGALTTISDLTSSTILDERLNVFGEVAAKFGGPAIRNVATVGGNVCAASSSEDLLPVLLVLDAKVRLKSRTGERVTSLEQFLKGKRQTDLKPNEILVETFFSDPPARSACSFEKIGMRNSLIIALVNSAVYLQLEGYGNDARVQEVRIAFNRVQGKIPGRARVTEDKLRDRKVTEEPVEQCLSSLRSELKTTSDFRVGAEYRQDVACVLFKRAFKSCVTKLEAPN
jgi:CO/xanthine dehydrogenase FAD-binding subunit